MMLIFNRRMTPYNAGESAEFPEREARRIISEGFAVVKPMAPTDAVITVPVTAPQFPIKKRK